MCKCIRGDWKFPVTLHIFWNKKNGPLIFTITSLLRIFDADKFFMSCILSRPTFMSTITIFFVWMIETILCHWFLFIRSESIRKLEVFLMFSGGCRKRTLAWNMVMADLQIEVRFSDVFTWILVKVSREIWTQSPNEYKEDFWS